MNRFLRATYVLAFALFALACAQAQNFKGFYVGGNVGGAFGRTNVQTSPIFSPTGYFASTSTPAITAASQQEIRSSGFTGGGQAGYTGQWENLVFGGEVDFGAMSVDGRTSATATYPCCAPTAFTIAQRARASWLFTARPRLGLAFGKVLLYGTAGLAVTSVRYDALFTDTFATANESARVEGTKTGWVAGGGSEFRVAQHWSVKAEYLYARFGEASVTSTNLTAFSPPIAFPTNVFTHTAHLSAHIVRGGVNYRF